jgi:uncharacterized membrane protein YphA (DoxX/SURF4 family)
VRIVLGAIFLVAGVLKLGHAADLAAAISAYQLGLPPPFVATAAVALPPFELLLGIYLVAGFWPKVTATVAAVLLAFFFVAVTSAVARGLKAPCGCFGPGDSHPATWWTVARDAVMLAAAAYYAWWAWLPTNTTPTLKRRHS